MRKSNDVQLAQDVVTLEARVKDLSAQLSVALGAKSQLEHLVSDLETANASLIEELKLVKVGIVELKVLLIEAKLEASTFEEQLEASTFEEQLETAIQRSGFSEVLEAFKPHIPEDAVQLRYALGIFDERCKMCGKPKSKCAGHIQCEICKGPDGKHGKVRVQVGIKLYPNGTAWLKDGKEIPVYEMQDCPNDPGPCPGCGMAAGTGHRKIVSYNNKNERVMVDCPNQS